MLFSFPLYFSCYLCPNNQSFRRMPKNRILFLASWYPSCVSPYSGDFIQRHARVAARVADITVVHAVRDDNIRSVYEVSDTNGGLREIIVYYKGAGFRVMNFFRMMNAFRKGYNKAGNPDLVHLNTVFPAGIFALYLKFFHKKNYILSEHWTGFNPKIFRQFPFFKRTMIRWILNNAALVMPVSADLGEKMLKVSPGLKIEVMPNVVDTQKFIVPDQKQANPKLRFLHLSMLDDKHKNISGMLRVAKRLATEGFPFELHIGGNGPLDAISDFVKENNLEDAIFPFGALQHDQVPTKIAQADCFVLFSNYENQPCVQGEALACGIPLIGTDVGGIKEFLPEDCGILIAKADEDALYVAMKSVINGRKFADPADMHRFAVENFSAESLSSRFKNIYLSVLNES